jgi:hypothetical protein
VSDPIDIKALDEYLKGNSDISRRYREIGSEDVPPELDRRVLDEARAAVAGGGRVRSWLRWSAPLAVAASVVLVVTVVIESGVQNDASFATKQVAADKARAEQLQQAAEYKLQEQVAQQPQPERQREFAPEPPAVMAPQTPAAPAPAAAPPASLAKAETARLNTVAPTEEVTVAAKMRSQVEMTTPVTVVNSETSDSPAPQVAAEQPSFAAGSVAPVPARKEAAAAPAEADSADDLSSVSVTGNTRARRAGRTATAGPRATMSGSALATESRPAADEDAERADLRSDPQKWLEEIRELRRAGKVEEADRGWEQFHKAFPNFPVADDDLARKQR